MGYGCCVDEHSLIDPCTGNQRCTWSDFNSGNGEKVCWQHRWKCSPGERPYSAHCTRKTGRKLTALHGNTCFFHNRQAPLLIQSQDISSLCDTENLHSDLLHIPVRCLSCLQTALLSIKFKFFCQKNYPYQSFNTKLSRVKQLADFPAEILSILYFKQIGRTSTVCQIILLA